MVRRQKQEINVIIVLDEEDPKVGVAADWGAIRKNPEEHGIIAETERHMY